MTPTTTLTTASPRTAGSPISGASPAGAPSPAEAPSQVTAAPSGGSDGSPSSWSTATSSRTRSLYSNETTRQARSITGETWTEGFRAADSVLDVAQIWKRVPDLGAHTTLVKLEDAVHDVTLSRRDVRERAFGEIARFVRAYVLGRNGPETARRFDGVGAPRRDGAREAIDGAWKRETARNGDGVSALRRVDRAADGEIGGGRSG